VAGQLSVVIAAGLITAFALLLALLFAKRLRFWKEQILLKIAIADSNNAIAHEAIRAQFATAESDNARAHEVTRAQIQSAEQKLSDLQQQIRFSEEIDKIRPPASTREQIAPNDRYEEYIQFLNSLDPPNEAARRYLEIHLHRTARTLAMAPPPSTTGRALELGAYMQMTPALSCCLGYREVRAAYRGSPGALHTQSASARGKEVFRCNIDLFDAERDRFPYPDEHFDLVLACELIEHLVLDPMQMLLECRRVLAKDGALLITTPNIASHSSLARLLTASGNPQIYSLYPVASSENTHVREYTPAELAQMLAAAAFRVEYLFTEKICGYNSDEWTGPLLSQLGLPTEFRGEQMYCLARKSGEPAVVERRPAFLYEQ
jgi:SAM-dependent methyltransferase